MTTFSHPRRLRRRVGLSRFRHRSVSPLAIATLPVAAGLLALLLFFPMPQALVIALASAFGLVALINLLALVVLAARYRDIWMGLGLLTVPAATYYLLARVDNQIDAAGNVTLAVAIALASIALNLFAAVARMRAFDRTARLFDQDQE